MFRASVRTPQRTECIALIKDQSLPGIITILEDLNAKCLLFLFHSDQNQNSMTDCSKSEVSRSSFRRESRCSMRTDRRKDGRKNVMLTVAFRNYFAKSRKNKFAPGSLNEHRSSSMSFRQCYFHQYGVNSCWSVWKLEDVRVTFVEGSASLTYAWEHNVPGTENTQTAIITYTLL